MSSRPSWRLTTVICFLERSSRTTSLKRSGMIGRSAIRHFLNLGSYSSGSASCTRCPTAHVITCSGPSSQPSPFENGPGSTRARSRPTEGFSAITSVFDIGRRVAWCHAARPDPVRQEREVPPRLFGYRRGRDGHPLRPDLALAARAPVGVAQGPALLRALGPPGPIDH